MAQLSAAKIVVYNLRVAQADRPARGLQAMDVENYRDALLREARRAARRHGAKPLQWTMENNSGRQGDMADQASGNNEVHIQLKLKQTDAKILQAIEEALRRIEEGTYGVCRDCGEPIAGAAQRHSVDARPASPARKNRRRDHCNSELQQLLTDFAAERLALLQRHEAGARVVGHYDFNNTYQYVITREETHLAWLQSALSRAGCDVAGGHAPLPTPRRRRRARNEEPRPIATSSTTTRSFSARSSRAGANASRT